MEKTMGRGKPEHPGTYFVEDRSNEADLAEAS